MAAPSIFFYPNGGGNIKEIRCGLGLRKLSPRETFDRPTTINGIGAPTHNPIIGGLRVTLRKERMLRDTDKDMIADFFALENHLRRGGTIGVALERTKAFCAYVTPTPNTGDTTIYGGPNVYKDILTAQSITLALASGDRFWLESGNPDWRRERCTISGSTVSPFASSLTLTRGVVYDRDTDAGVMVRHEDFYPACYLPEDQLGQSLMTDENGALYTFEAELEVDVSIYGANAEGDAQALILAVTTAPIFAGDTMLTPADSATSGFALITGTHGSLNTPVRRNQTYQNGAAANGFGK